MAMFNFSHSLIILIAALIQRTSRAAIISIENPSQLTTVGEDIDSSIPTSLPLDDDKTEFSPVCTCVTHLRGGSNIVTSSDVVSEEIQHDRFSNALASVRPEGKSKNSSSENSRKRRRQRALMDYESISCMLRLTCEINRRLQCATNMPSVLQKSESSSGQTGHSVLDSIGNGGYKSEHYHHQQEHHHHQQQQQEQPSNPVHVHPSQAWQPPIREGMVGSYHDLQRPFLPHDQHKSINNNEVTGMTTVTTPLFDTAPHERKNLTIHVQCISEAIEHNPIISAIALLILDRASSVETRRGLNDYVHNFDHLYEKTSPYVTPCTVHKLYQTAIILATRMVRRQIPPPQLDNMFQDEYTNYYAQLLTSSGIEVIPHELGQMLEWMYHSLGVEGVNIPGYEVDRLLTFWKGLFVWENEVEEGFEDNYGDGSNGADTFWRPSPTSWGANTNNFEHEILDS